MFKLYYTPGACSLSPHIALREAGLPFELVRVDLRGKRLSDGGDFFGVSPKGYVPALVLENGELLTEGAVMIQYIADQKPEAALVPAQGTFERLRMQETLNFIATELHKAQSPLYSPHASEEYKTVLKERIAQRFAILAKQLDGKAYLFGDQFTVADGYAFYTLRSWQKFMNGDLPAGLAAYHTRIAERPHVKAALEAEGLAGK